MRLLFLAGLATISLTGCLAMVPDDTIVVGYDGIKTPAEYWVRELEHASEQQGAQFQTSPAEFKECVGREMVKMSPPDLTSAVERFVQNQNAGNYKALVPLVTRFSSGYEEAYGVKPGTKAGQICSTSANAFDGITDVESFWLREVSAVQTSGPDSFRQCIAEELTRITSGDLRDAIVHFIANRSDANYQRALRLVTDFKNKFQAERGLTPADYAVAICRAKLHL